MSGKKTSTNSVAKKSFIMFGGLLVLALSFLVTKSSDQGLSSLLGASAYSVVENTEVDEKGGILTTSEEVFTTESSASCNGVLIPMIAEKSLCPVITQEMVLGMRDGDVSSRETGVVISEVKKLQTLLRDTYGFSDIIVDGYFSENTKNAAIKYQEERANHASLLWKKTGSSAYKNHNYATGNVLEGTHLLINKEHGCYAERIFDETNMTLNTGDIDDSVKQLFKNTSTHNTSVCRPITRRKTTKKYKEPTKPAPEKITIIPESVCTLTKPKVNVNNFGISAMQTGSFKNEVLLALAKEDSTGNTISWALDFGDGTNISGTNTPGTNIAHTYQVAGVYEIRVSSVDERGLESSQVALFEALEPTNAGSSTPLYLRHGSYLGDSSSCPDSFNIGLSLTEGISSKGNYLDGLGLASSETLHTWSADVVDSRNQSSVGLADIKVGVTTVRTVSTLSSGLEAYKESQFEMAEL